VRSALPRLGPLLVLLAAACSTPEPQLARRQPAAERRIHIVRPGETLWAISQRYGTTVEALAQLNDLADPTRIRTAQLLVVPAQRSVPRARREDPWSERDPRGKSDGSHRFRWPLSGDVTSSFGVRNGAHHDGIDISVRSGTPVRAAEAGRVIHSDDSLAGYGNLIIVKHAGAFSSVYAHNRRNLARVGEFVEQGQLIAESGQTGRASAPHLHFEIRRDGRPLNPLIYLE
jgi:murein DD-endopeptidase MepM/ murein hydrolase activator NlpD